ncbi:MAG: rhodanese-like domain-containing protein [Chitinophagaceae bacterium]|nr:MAG: rhodanese-like domain-containing protein [Chitinophagaceae bacterium]
MQLTSIPQTIIDVRSPEEFHGYHIPGALNIPVDQITEKIEDLKTMEGPVLVYCRSGVRSRMATILLNKGDIKDVIDGGGINDVIKNLNL